MKYDLSDPVIAEKFFSEVVDPDDDPEGRQALKLVDFKAKTGFYCHQPNFQGHKQAVAEMERNKKRITLALDSARRGSLDGYWKQVGETLRGDCKVVNMPTIRINANRTMAKLRQTEEAD